MPSDRLRLNSTSPQPCGRLSGIGDFPSPLETKTRYHHARKARARNRPAPDHNRHRLLDGRHAARPHKAAFRRELLLAAILFTLLKMNDIKAPEKHEVPFRGGLYLGELRNGLPHGVGTYTCEAFTYIGSWFYGTMSGLGVIRYPDGSFYKGEFYADHRHGQGEEDVFGPAGKSRYVGGWRNDLKHGNGIEISVLDGKIVRQEGKWKNGVKI